MTDNKNGSAGQDQSSGSDQGNNNQNADAGSAGEGKKDSVSYETHQRLLGQHKKAQARLDELEKIFKEQTEKNLKEKEDFKTLYETAKTELSKKESEISEFRQQLELSKKYKAFSSYLKEKHGAELASQDYAVLIDWDKVVINPDTGEIDKTVLANYVDDFAKSRKHIIVRPNDAKLPADSPKGGSNTISYDEWLKLPSKEMTKYKPDQII